MKNSARVWLVMVFLGLALVIVYSLSVSTPQSGANASPDVAPLASRQTSVAPTQSNSTAEIALSPDLRKTNAYEFLDPVLVGKKAPEFTAKTAEGKAIRLASYKGKKNVVLVFYQGSFCSVCGAQLTNIQKHLSDFRAQDAEVIAISADDASHAMLSVGEHGLTFPVVPDVSKSIIKQYGIGNISKKGIAWPSLFIIDKKGVTRLSFASPEGHRMHSNEILPVLSKITGKPAPHLSYNN